jgi:PPM family protein phosphatase
MAPHPSGGSEPAPGGPVARVWGMTHRGRVRSENQDTFLIVLPGPEHTPVRIGPDGEPPPGSDSYRLEPGSRGLSIIVCDGMGGAAGGATASRVAAESIAHELEEGIADEAARSARRTWLENRLRRAVETANRRVHGKSRQEAGLAGMGTTATVASILEDEVHLAQVGDSRAYLIRNGTAEQLTRDQTMGQELLDQGRMTPAEARSSVHRHILTQAVGTEASIQVAVSSRRLEPGDIVLVCSDGLTGHVDAEELAAEATRHPDPSELARTLVRLANERGGTDNITVVVARLEEDDEA